MGIFKSKTTIGPSIFVPELTNIAIKLWLEEGVFSPEKLSSMEPAFKEYFSNKDNRNRFLHEKLIITSAVVAVQLVNSGIDNRDVIGFIHYLCDEIESRGIQKFDTKLVDAFGGLVHEHVIEYDRDVMKENSDVLNLLIHYAFTSDPDKEATTLIGRELLGYQRGVSLLASKIIQNATT